ncbi:NADH:flavin oxidoreductase/NADH oxidase [Polyporus arcularius HHB13444]|uniref:NADH:flavin oxidoreductase/NADH oxidase n=1 Tax=Polyporus arcularius HHB13444 TaxID=1314778 RepID=A0A5C3PXR4_9APHY|nr:NADH:flavin oxidoreductase/NADH oxidase [Polyporus arcularius HHB13444]
MGEQPEPVPTLFQPVRVGDVTLGHRVVLAPLTRIRANNRHVHTDLGVTYYAQRASVPGTLLITEATFIAPYAGHFSPHAPGVWNEEQTAAWKRIADAVHERGSFIYMQIWALGRAAVPAALKAESPDYPYVSASAIPLSDRPEDVPRALTIPEIKQYVEAFAQAARNAVHGAGCDGVEVHAAHGYLIDQFTQDVSNKRTDEYGGSIENRCRFALEVIDAVVAAVGAKKTAFRISPWSTFQDMRMEDPILTFTYLVSQVLERHPDIAYLSVVEPGLAGGIDIEARQGESNDFLRKLWLPRAFISAGRYTRESAIKRADETGELIAFGRRFISNPDLPLRLRKNIPLIPWERATYHNPEDPHGYIDYPFAEESSQSTA